MKISLKNDPKSFKSTLHLFPTMNHFQIHGEDVEIPYLSNGGYRIDGNFFINNSPRHTVYCNLELRIRRERICGL